MAGDLYQEQIASLLKQAFDRIYAVERRLSIAAKEAELSEALGPETTTLGPDQTRFMYYTTEVVTPDSANKCFTGKIMVPVDNSNRWTQSTTFTSLVTVDVPDGITVPAAGAIVGSFNTGPYARNKSRYALFGAGGGAAKQFRFKEMFGDYYRCVTWDGTTEGSTTVDVAKPMYLRQSPFDGQTINGITYTFSTNYTFRWARNSLTPVSTIRQIIIPYYVTNDLIYASEISNGAGAVSTEGSLITYQDMNVDGRFWVRD